MLIPTTTVDASLPLLLQTLFLVLKFPWNYPRRITRLVVLLARRRGGAGIILTVVFPLLLVSLGLRKKILTRISV